MKEDQVDDLTKEISELQEKLKKKEEDFLSNRGRSPIKKEMFMSAALSGIGGEGTSKQIDSLKRKNMVLKKENELIRKELKAVKEMNKSRIMDASALSVQNESEVVRLTKQVAKLKRAQRDVRIFS